MLEMATQKEIIHVMCSKPDTDRPVACRSAITVEQTYKKQVTKAAEVKFNVGNNNTT
jgi:hypothetical protein